MLCVHFQKVFVEFVALLTKIWPKLLIFTVTAKCWREGCFCPPPLPLIPSHQEVIDAIMLFFSITTYINNAQ